MLTIRALLGCYLLFALSLQSTRADVQAHAILHFSDGDFLSGKFVDSENAETLRWQSTVATNPFDFKLENVSAIHFPAPDQQELIAADYCFELSGGDRLFGSLKGISNDRIEIEAPPFGTLHVDRTHLVRITRQSGGAREWVFLGPHGLAGWDQFPNENPWREEAGHLITDVPGATIRNECKIPEKACIEFEISWKKKPDFILLIGEGPKPEAKPEPAQRGRVRVIAPVEIRTRSAPVTTEYRFEVWETALVIVSERRAIADAAFVTELPAGEGRIHLRSYLDRKTGRLSVYTHDGKRLAQITVPDPEEAVGIEVRNKRGDIRLERLAVSSWDGKLPTEVATDKPNLQKADGSVVYGNVSGFDTEAKQFLVDGENGEERVNAAEMTTLLVTPKTAAFAAPLRVALNTGASVMGRLVAVRDNNLHVQRDGIEEQLEFPISAVRSLLGSTPQSSESGNSTTAARNQGYAKNKEGDFDRVGRLEADGVRSHGWLVDGTSDAGGSCLVWQPRQSTTSSQLVSGLSGQLVYRDPPPPPQPKNVRNTRPARPAARPGIWGEVLDAFGVPKNNNPRPAPQAVSKKSLLHLRAGDNVPCEVTGVDEEGVYIKSEAVDATFIPHAQVKAIELSTDAKLPELDEKKRERLLTLPRMLRNNPPTHLLIATNGDVLRGRLQEMNEEHVAVEIHLETRDLQREYVASIIWLHGGELEVSKDEPNADADASMLVQAVRPDGIRLTFTPHSVIDNALVGESKTLGACRVDLQTVDVLLLGDRIQEAADELEYHTWKLVHAPDPQYLQDEESGGGPGPAVSSSGLIGNEAPEFRLDLLTGKQFRLSEQKGHVVVLDFWASWCGPCMQAMPMVDEVIREFEAQGVELVTVNMQEDADTVKGALERLKLDSTVALDIDGATAEKYEVTAIPQTVVIDAEGKVSHLFVGGGSQLPEQLREALAELTADKESQE